MKGRSWVLTSRIGLVESNGAVVSNVGNMSTDTDDDLRKFGGKDWQIAECMDRGSKFSSWVGMKDGSFICQRSCSNIRFVKNSSYTAVRCN